MRGGGGDWLISAFAVVLTSVVGFGSSKSHLPIAPPTLHPAPSPGAPPSSS